MSHIPQRQEKDCLNCGTIVQGRYCQNCGQENVVPKETFWHMVTHFFYDITHFDSSFFHTTYALIFKPGFLTSEYMRGKRSSYLHPIRFYVFSSAMFFLLFFSAFKPENISFTDTKPLTSKERRNSIKELQEYIKKDSSEEYKRKLALALDTTRKVMKSDVAIPGTEAGLNLFTTVDFKNQAEYDAYLAGLSPKKRDGWFLQRLIRKQIDINEKYRKDPDGVPKELAKSFLHRLPYMLFLSLPLFALILRLCYIRRKQFYYADHGVFTIHLYVFTFIILTAVFLFGRLEDWTGWGIWEILTPFLFVGLFAYLLIAMKRFYGQGWLKTIIKFLLVFCLSMLMMLVLFVLFMIFSALTF